MVKSRTSEIEVVDLDVVFKDLRALANLAILGSTRFDADKMFAVLLVGRLLVRISMVGLLDEGTIALEVGRDPLGVGTATTVLTDAILLLFALDDRLSDEHTAVGHVELVDSEIDGSPLLLLALKRKLDGVGKDPLSSRNDVVVASGLLLLPLVLGDQLGETLGNGGFLQVLDNTLGRLARIYDDDGLALKVSGRLASLDRDAALGRLNGLDGLDRRNRLDRLDGSAMATEATGLVETVFVDGGENHCKECRKRKVMKDCSVMSVCRLVVDRRLSLSGGGCGRLSLVGGRRELGGPSSRVYIGGLERVKSSSLLGSHVLVIQ
jgi:hypothetical protein